ncbi:MBL fold metallo-hydrolase [Longimicrobium sp.]|uniref:MBL fold metallo-hydrolase n=1 Tax=Longimicrobium sp. TaxID=2029185 RepID=UPI002CC99338|nr:MBL fold metallo-hydrolase [Longimicrobium sp.]HSU16484.1 MBL fold metallo-hydrolase [Longimicrobium sp.]
MGDARRGDVVVRGFTGGVFAENTYLLSCAATNAGILVDPGAATAQALAEAKRHGIEIGAIVLTHAHIDHVEGIPLARVETGAPIWLHDADRELYQAAPMQAQWFGLRMDPLPPVDHALVVGETVRFGECELEIRFAPGHAPGHVILVGDGVAMVGDVVFAGSIGRTDLPGGDLATLMRSIREQVLTLPDATTLHTGHGPDTTVGHERATNPFIIGDYGGSQFA